MSSKPENTEIDSQIPTEIATETSNKTAEDVAQEVVGETSTEDAVTSEGVFSKDTCLNCGTHLNGVYCHNCGQHVTDHTMTVKRFVMDYLDNAFMWDSRIIFTLKTLITSPGTLTKEYLAGKFVSQVQPLKLNMFLLFVFVTLFVFFGSDQKMNNTLQDITNDERFYAMLRLESIASDEAFMQRIEASPRDTVTVLAPLYVSETYPTIIETHRVIYDLKGDSLDQWVAVVPRVLIEEQIILPQDGGYYHFNPDVGGLPVEILLLQAVGEQMLSMALQYFPMIVLLTAPFLAFSLRVVQRRKKRPFYDHFVFSMHYVAFVELIIIVIYLMYLVLGLSVDALNILFLVCSCLYLAISFREVYATTWFRSATKAVLSSLIYCAICMSIFFVLLLVACYSVAQHVEL